MPRCPWSSLNNTCMKILHSKISTKTVQITTFFYCKTKHCKHTVLFLWLTSSSGFTSIKNILCGGGRREIDRSHIWYSSYRNGPGSRMLLLFACIDNKISTDLEKISFHICRFLHLCKVFWTLSAVFLHFLMAFQSTLRWATLSNPGICWWMVHWPSCV